jgi:hypothetical protein
LRWLPDSSDFCHRLVVGADNQPDQVALEASYRSPRLARAGLKGSTMSDTPMPVTGFALDMATSEDSQTMVALLTLETGELTFEFAINDEGARAMVENLQQFVELVRSNGRRNN